MSGCLPQVVVGDDWSRAWSYVRESDSAAIAIPDTATVRAALVAKNTHEVLAGPVICLADAEGADWASGVVVTSFSSLATGQLSRGLCELELEVTDDAKSTVHALVRVVAGGIG